MGKLSSFFSKIPFLSGLGGKKKSAKSNVELQYDKALNLMENGNAEDAVEILEKIVDIAIMDQNYKNFGTDALKILGELYETGKYSNCIVDVNLNKATQYYEKYTNLSKDGEMIYKLAQMLLKYNELDFTPNCSFDLLNGQLKVMELYMDDLEERAEIEGIEL